MLWVIPRCQAASACSPYPDTRWYFSMVRIHRSIFMPFTKAISHVYQIFPILVQCRQKVALL